MLHFGNKVTREIYQFGVAKGVPDEVAQKAVRQLDIMAAATNLQENPSTPQNRRNRLLAEASNKREFSRLQKLKGDVFN